jgi:hypothetical protein
MSSKKFWRNSSTQKYSRIKALLLHIWLIPGIPVGTTLLVILLGNRRRYGRDLEERNPMLALLDYTSEYTFPVLVFTGFILWVWTVQALSQPLIIKTLSGISFNSSGFAGNQFSYASISKISVYRLFPLGCLLDIKSPIGTNVRSFAFMANINKEKLQAYLGDKIKVNV